jgi:hypothetical protein
MASRRSILTAVREEKPVTEEPSALPQPEPPAQPVTKKVKPSRVAKKHIGGYYDPKDSTIIAFQKLGIDLDKDQQEMLHEAISDFVAKHQAASRFN